MAPLNMQRVVEALKLFYLDGLRFQLNEATSEFLNAMERDSKSVQGDKIVMALRYGRSGGVGNRADDGDLPKPNARKTKQAKWETKNVFARMWITDKVIRASRGKAGAFRPMLEATLEDLENDAKFSLSRQAWGDGTGRLATIPGGGVVGNDITVGLVNIWLFAEGMLIDSYTPLGVLRQGEMEILAVDDINGVITVDNAGATAAADEIYIAGSKDLELTGIAAVVNAPVLYDINRAQNPWLNMTNIPVNGQISEVIIKKGIDEVKKKTGAKTDYLTGSQGVVRAYFALMVAQKQIVNTINLKGGGKALSFNGLPMVDDLFAPAQKLYGFAMSDWKLYEMGDWDWLDRDGNMIARVPGKPVWEATLCKYCDLGVSRPRGQVELSGIVEH